jgi:opacity protein-like surface antigen
MIVASNDQPSSKHQSESSHSEHSENHFAGPYIVLTNEWKRASAKVDGEKISKSESAPSFSIGYTYALNSSYTLGLKISADFKSGEYGAGEVAARAVGSETKVVEKNHYSIAVEPGYVVNNQLLVFGILAYHTALAEIEGAAGSARMNGVGYGLGFKHTIADHLFLMGELQQIGYGSKTIDGSTVKPSSTVGAIGLGYHF